MLARSQTLPTRILAFTRIRRQFHTSSLLKLRVKVKDTGIHTETEEQPAGKIDTSQLDALLQSAPIAPLTGGKPTSGIIPRADKPETLLNFTEEELKEDIDLDEIYRKRNDKWWWAVYITVALMLLSTLDTKPKKDPKEQYEKSKNVAFGQQNDLKVVLFSGPPGTQKLQRDLATKLQTQYPNTFLYISVDDKLRNGDSSIEKTLECLKQEIEKEIERARINSSNSRASPRIIIIDSLPNTLKSLLSFETQLIPCWLTLYFNSPIAQLRKQIKKDKAYTSEERKQLDSQLETYGDRTKSVFNYLQAVDKLITIDCDDELDDMYNQLKSAILSRLK